ncbi:uncharacterized protein LOC110266633 isoform X2 [Arachis ipaensis]|uniref:uncharacterized protein LOC110266633 isoform X1 n=1 Tax=Arachis ipaensis TaxID=130454 RepID=UPI000A2B9576|nr:uncharacterized protein LOC110266633 isoform X1 [Arachis ipaensis]XP_020967192.1 uncharacterized protein LOC110266633 isoform X2 [Arachis ipaensis]
MVEVGPAPANEVIEGDVIGNGENEAKRRARARASNRGVRGAPEQVENPSSLPEFRAQIFIVLGEDGFRVQRLLRVDRVNSEKVTTRETCDDGGIVSAGDVLRRVGVLGGVLG